MHRSRCADRANSATPAVARDRQRDARPLPASSSTAHALTSRPAGEQQTPPSLRNAAASGSPRSDRGEGDTDKRSAHRRRDIGQYAPGSTGTGKTSLCSRARTKGLSRQSLGALSTCAAHAGRPRPGARARTLCTHAQEPRPRAQALILDDWGLTHSPRSSGAICWRSSTTAMAALPPSSPVRPNAATARAIRSGVSASRISRSTSASTASARASWHFGRPSALRSATQT